MILKRDFLEPSTREVAVAVTALADRLFCARYAGWKRLDDQAGPAVGEDDGTRVPEIEAAVLGATESGRLIHAMLDAADLDAEPGVRRQRMIARALAQQGLAAERLSAPERKRVEELSRRADQWLAKAAVEWESAGVEPRREWPFLIRVGGSPKPMLVRGVIDLWTEGSDGPHQLVDFKLAKPKEPGATLYAFQLGVYAWALEKIKGKRPREVWLEHLVEPPQSVAVDVSETVAQLASGGLLSSLASEPEIKDDANVLALEGHQRGWCAAKKCPHLARCHGISLPA